MIDWDKAPEWASWVAMDEDGSWWWYENAPELDVDDCWTLNGGRYLEAGVNISETLQERPQ